MERQRNPGQRCSDAERIAPDYATAKAVASSRLRLLCEFAAQVLTRSRHARRLPNVERLLGSGAGSLLGAPAGASSTLNALAMSAIARTAPNTTSVSAAN